MIKTKNEIREQRGKIVLIIMLMIPFIYVGYYFYLTNKHGQDIESIEQNLKKKIKTYVSMKNTAEAFGRSLDNDDFALTKTLLTADCEYFIGDTTLIGKEAIAGSYESNMIAGRKKMDQLEWGKSRVEAISETEFFVHFTDYLTHKDETYIHRCKQKITVSSEGKVIRIEHIENSGEQQRLDAFYKRVGIN